jgi:hypothetical protein
MDGWIVVGSLKEPGRLGNWHVEDGVLAQLDGGDGFLAFLDIRV